MSAANLERIERLLDQLTVEELLTLAEHIMLRLKRAIQDPQQRKPQDLYGIWREYFPADLDIDAELQEIRSR